MKIENKEGHRKLPLLLFLSSFILHPSSFLVAAGTTSADFLSIRPGARAAGMGEAHTSLADDAFAVYWNPAGLANVRSPEISATYNRWVEDVNHQFAAFAFPTDHMGTFALGLNRLGADSFQGFDAQGAFGPSLKTGGDSFSAGWGKNLWRDAPAGSGVLAGLAVKHVRERHADVEGASPAVDAGLIIRPWAGKPEESAWLERTSLGAAVKNLGPGIKFDEKRSPLPLELSGGASYSHFLSGDILTLAADLHKTLGDTFLGAGVEYRLKGFLALRAGYRAGRSSRIGAAGLRAGGGMRFKAFQIDYAWAGMGEDLGAAHRFSLTYRFGRQDAALMPGLASDLFAHYVDRGRLLMERGMPDAALLNFHQALRIHPQDPEVLQLLLECGQKIKEGRE
ncbi:MAG: PorV/PorQ family protein [Elusimicrobiota bacterium]